VNKRPFTTCCLLRFNQGEINLVLEKRKGFIREAIMAGASLVPVIAFGENDLYVTFDLRPDHWFSKLQNAVKKYLGFAIPLFKGRSVTFRVRPAH